MRLFERVMLLVFDYWTCSVLTTLFAQLTPRVALVAEEYLQVFGVPPIDLHPNMTVVGFLRREMDVFDRQSLRINENCCLHRVKREIRPITVAIARLITLEATRVNGSNASPTDLLRAEPEQVSKLFHVVFLLPPADGRVIR